MTKELMNSVLDELNSMDGTGTAEYEFAMMYKLKKALDEKYDEYKSKLLLELPDGYSNIHPDLEVQLTIRPGKETAVYDYKKMQQFLGPELWSEISTTTQGKIKEVLGPIEADKCLAMARVSTSYGSATIDIRPITKSNK